MGKIAINGFGRIGRSVFKAILSGENNLEVVAINDLSEPKTLEHLLKYDTAYGRYDKKVVCRDGVLEVGEEGKRVELYAEKDPAGLPWGDLGVDVVLECTGLFTHYDGARKHIDAGAKKVIISAPSKDPDKIPSFIRGVNEENYNPEEHEIVDMGSCTTNCLAPVLKILHENYNVKSGTVTTVHSYTMDQNLLDGAHRDLRRGRAAAANIVPTTTGAAKAVGKVIPELDGKINGIAIRVPSVTVSVIDLVCVIEKQASKEEINLLFKKESEKERWRGVLKAEDDPLVSSDYVGSSHACVVDTEMTLVKENMVKVLAWYDNEWGYSSQLAAFADYITRRL